MWPIAAAPMPLTPNIRPKKIPAIMPTLPGTSSCANTTIAENADDITSPITVQPGEQAQTRRASRAYPCRSRVSRAEILRVNLIGPFLAIKYVGGAYLLFGQAAPMTGINLSSIPAGRGITVLSEASGDAVGGSAAVARSGAGAGIM